MGLFWGWVLDGDVTGDGVEKVDKLGNVEDLSEIVKKLS